MFQNIIQDSIWQEKELSESDLHSPNTMDLEPFSDFESQFHLSHFTEGPLLQCWSDVSPVLQKIKEEDTYSNQQNQDIYKRKQKFWNDEEDQRLKYLYNYYEGKWNEIVKKMPQRNASQCQQRWRRINPPKKAKQNWTLQQDDQLKQLVHQFGKQWMKIAKLLGNITGKQARDRYINKLDQSINKQPWTHEEDMLVLDYFVNNGPKWTKISNLLIGRPENNIKNRFYSFIKRNYLGEQNRYQIIYF
ncbi:unnamed protein product [Paramecium sonneborni]|uniref:Uncharacterized protein n=1 Tax=Paramecium sonneborni TaxID=65129 RepID=A0A8S1KG89_9CILI|nr:unnamed protein product [Paramecium sonneborni]